MVTLWKWQKIVKWSLSQTLSHNKCTTKRIVPVASQWGRISPKISSFAPLPSPLDSTSSCTSKLTAPYQDNPSSAAYRIYTEWYSHLCCYRVVICTYLVIPSSSDMSMFSYETINRDKLGTDVIHSRFQSSITALGSTVRETYLSIKKLEQGWFACTIGPHQCYPGLEIYAKVYLSIDKGLASSIPEADMLYHDDRRWNTTTVWKSKRDNLKVKIKFYRWIIIVSMSNTEWKWFQKG